MKGRQQGEVRKLLLLIIVPQLSSLEVVHQTHVNEYVIERRGGGNSDLFILNYENGSYCHKNQDLVYKWCEKLNASVNNSVTTKGKSCGCSCRHGFATFLPQKLTCINKNEAKSFGGCSRYIHLGMLSARINLSVASSEKLTSSRDNCAVISGHYFDYNGFHDKWEKIQDQIFIFNNSNNQLKFQWRADKSGTLSGRIIRLHLTCYNTRNSPPRSSYKWCMLFKALGTVTYYAPSKTSSAHSVPTASSSHTSSSLYLSLASCQLPQSTQTSSLSPKPQPSPSPFPSLAATAKSPTKHTHKFSTFSSMHMETSSLQTRPAGLILSSTSTAELKSSVGTGKPYYSEPSELPTTELNLPARDGPGDKEARKGGNDIGVAIGAGIGGAVAFGIIVIGLTIIFCKGRKSRESTEKKAKLDVGVKNPVYGKPLDNIEIERSREKAKTFGEQGSQPTYLELVDKEGHENYGAVYSSLDENYDNSSVNQSLNKNTLAAPPVYQSLQNNQPSTKKPIRKQKLSHAKNPEKPSVQPDPVYSVLAESDTKQGDMSEALYNVLEGPDAGHDTLGNIQDPVYNVLDGPDAEQTYEDPDVGVQQDPLYNVLEVPESKQEHQEPLYNVLESADTESACSRQEAPYNGAISEPLYNVLDGEDSGGANVSGAEYASPDRPLWGHDNPAYEQTLELGVPNAVVHSPGSQRESFYQPLEGSDRQDVYEPLQKRKK